MFEINVETLSHYIDVINKNTKTWTNNGFAKPWFRGQTDKEYCLLPSIFRKNVNTNIEFELTTKFRLLAPGFGDTPETGRIDQWLFLMQHHEIPTRLLDWSESPLIALYFALQKCLSTKNEKKDVAVYAIDPIELNKMSGMEYFPNTWVQSSVLQTIKFAFGTQNELVNNRKIMYLSKPVAIYPSVIHSRIKTQKGCFTLHGSDRRSFEDIFQNSEIIKNKYLFRIIIQKANVDSMFYELNNFGISNVTLYQDLDGLSKDIKYQFGIK
jgi:hypothetical protein